jgi:hypothetical protein
MIAERFGVPLLSLIIWNGLDVARPIHPGDRLVIHRKNISQEDAEEGETEQDRFPSKERTEAHTILSPSIFFFLLEALCGHGKRGLELLCEDRDFELFDHPSKRLKGFSFFAAAMGRKVLLALSQPGGYSSICAFFRRCFSALFVPL